MTFVRSCAEGKAATGPSRSVGVRTGPRQDSFPTSGSATCIFLQGEEAIPDTMQRPSGTVAVLRPLHFAQVSGVGMGVGVMNSVILCILRSASGLVASALRPSCGTKQTVQHSRPSCRTARLALCLEYFWLVRPRHIISWIREAFPESTVYPNACGPDGFSEELRMLQLRCSLAGFPDSS